MIDDRVCQTCTPTRSITNLIWPCFLKVLCFTKKYVCEKIHFKCFGLFECYSSSLPISSFFQFTEETQKAVWHVKGTTFLFFPYLENSDGICSYSLEMSCLNKQKRPLSNPQKLCYYRVSKTNLFWQKDLNQKYLIFDLMYGIFTNFLKKWP